MGWKDTIKEDKKISTKSKGWKSTITESPDVVEDASKPLYQEVGETLSDVVTTIPQGVTTWSEEIGAAPVAAGKSLLEDRPFMEVYDEELAKMRQNIASARERSPWATAIGEAGAGIGTSFLPVAGAGKLAGAGAQILRSGVEGLGTAEDKLGIEGGVQAGIGLGLGAMGSLVGGAVKKLTTANPNAIRANVLGARTSEFKEIGLKEREEIAKQLKDMGLFSNTKVDFDVTKGKFIPLGKSLESLEKPASDKLLNRLNEATKKLQTEKLKILGKFANDPVDFGDIEDALDQVSVAYSKKAVGMPERLAAAQEIKNKIILDIAQDMEELGLEAPTIELIERAKQRIGEDVGNYGKNPLLQKTPDSAQIYQNMYASINKKLRSLIGNNKYAKYNDIQQKMITAKTDLAKSIASENAQKAQAGWGGWFNKMANETLGSPEAGLGMANVAEFMNRPGISKLKTPTRLGVMEAPFSAMRQLDVSMPDQTPVVEEQDNYVQPEGYNFYNTKKAFGRTPQGYTDVNPVALSRMKLPRSSAEWIKNKDLVLQKMAAMQVEPDLIDAAAEALNYDHGKVEGIAKTISSMYPEMLETSRYNVFNGIIVDPNERAKAADDTSKRDDLGSIQKAKIIRELNKSGKWLGE